MDSTITAILSTILMHKLIPVGILGLALALLSRKIPAVRRAMALLAPYAGLIAADLVIFLFTPPSYQIAIIPVLVLTGWLWRYPLVRRVVFLIAPYLGLIFVYTIFLCVAPPSFHSLYNTKTFLTQAVIIGIGSLGMTMIIISGGIDLSVGSLIALGTVIAAMVLKAYGGAASGFSYYAVPALAACAAIAACGTAGFINGAAITGLRIVPFIVTLGTMQIARGVAKGLAHQTTINVPDNWLNSLMIVEPRTGVWYSVAPGLWLLLALLVAVAALLKYTVFGRYIFAIGSNESTARLCGVSVGLNRFFIYGLAGVLIGVASVMQFSNLSLGDPTAAIGMELDIIAAVVIGGGSLSGGSGSALGSIVGAVIMAILRNGCNLVGIENYVQNIIVGAIIITAVALDRFKAAKA